MAKKKLKPGFTTGAAAAAAVKGALFCLLFDENKEQVSLRFLTGEITQIPIHRVEKISETEAVCSVIKDAGDDPDVTHRAEIGVRVLVSDRTEDKKISITGGRGVGRVTKPGLELPPGSFAINPGPVTMITESVEELLQKAGAKENKGVDIEIFIPQGQLLAQKTLNKRLGIIGGLSILGTTGIVKPMSHDAYKSSIGSAISVAAAMGEETVVLTTGRRSERFAMALFPGFKEEAFIQIGDFFKASLERAAAEETIGSVIFTVFFGKAVKMAMGFPHTHAGKSTLTLETLAGWARELSCDLDLVGRIETANTARHAFDHIHPGFPELIGRVGEKIRGSALEFSNANLNIGVIILDFDGHPVFNSVH